MTTETAPAPIDTFTALGVTFHLNDVSRQLAVSAYRNTSFSAERRADQVRRDYLNGMEYAAARFTEAAETHPDRKERATDMLREYRAGYLTRLNAYLSAHAGCASWMITGRSKFPVRQQEKRWASADRRSTELYEYTTTRLNRLIKLLTRPPRATAAERADDLRRRIESAQDAQEMMKQANKLIRDKKLPAKLAEQGMTLTDALVALGYSHSTAEALQKPDFANRIGFPAYALSNNNAEIARLKRRLAEEEAKAAQAQIGPVTREYDTTEGRVTYEEHPDDNRVRLGFPGKPSEATRALLKGRGFKWSPRNEAWQRFLTGQGQYAAKKVLEALEATEAEPIDFTAIAAQVRAGRAAGGQQ